MIVVDVTSCSLLQVIRRLVVGVKSCSLLQVIRRFGGTCCAQLEGHRTFF
jgi:hypothetical protein